MKASDGISAAGTTVWWMCFAATTAMAAKFGVDLYNYNKDTVKDSLESLEWKVQNKLDDIMEKRKEKRIKELMDYIDKNGIK